MKNRDRGYAFLVLTAHAPKVPIANTADWVNATLKQAGLPELSELKRNIEDELSRLPVAYLQGMFSEHCEAQINIGLKLFNEYGPCFDCGSILQRLASRNLSLPPIILGQDGAVVAGGNICDFDKSSVSELFDQIASAYGRCTEFVDACGV